MPEGSIVVQHTRLKPCHNEAEREGHVRGPARQAFAARLLELLESGGYHIVGPVTVREGDVPDPYYYAKYTVFEYHIEAEVTPVSKFGLTPTGERQRIEDRCPDCFGQRLMGIPTNHPHRPPNERLTPA